VLCVDEKSQIQALDRQCPRFCVTVVPRNIARRQASSFAVPLRPDLWIFGSARTAVKAERSEFIAEP
jgi:hypothetical protein